MKGFFQQGLAVMGFAGGCSSFVSEGGGGLPRASSPIDTSVYGTWKVDETRNENGGMNIYFKFEEGKVTLLNRCEFKGYSTLASATAPAEMTSDTIRIMENRSVTERVATPADTLTFKVNLRKSVMRYRLENGKLIIEAEGHGRPMELPRAAEA